MKTNKRAAGGLSLGAVTILAVVVFSTAALLISSIIFLYRFNSTIKKTAITTTEQIVGHVGKTIDTYMDTMLDNIRVIENVVVENMSIDDLTAQLNILYNLRSDLVSIVLYDVRGNMLRCISGEENELKPNTYANLSYRYEGSRMEEGYEVSPPHVNNLFKNKYQWVVTVSKEVFSKVYQQDVKIAIDVGFSSLASYIDDARIGEKGYCYIVNSNKEIIYHPKQQLLYTGLMTEDTAFLELGSGTHVTSNIIYRVLPTDNTDWVVVGQSYVDELILAKRNEAVWFSVIIFVFSLAVLLLFGVVISYGLSRPARKLILSMKAFEKNVADFQIQSVGGFSEIRNLDDSFNHMVERIKNLMEQIKREEKQLRKMEFKAMQEQINPHFLYNTLDSILWMSERGQTGEVSKMVAALAKLLRIGLSNGSEIITVADELRHLESYLIIQSIRYKNQFTYSFEVDEDILSCRCIKIMLQPFVENSIYHGIDRMVDEGKITVKGSRAGDNLEFRIVDNGLGMEQSVLEDVLEGRVKGKGGFAIKNVTRRIRIYFGEEYGVTMSSELDVGTEVTVRIPAFTEERYERNN